MLLTKYLSYLLECFVFTEVFEEMSKVVQFSFIIILKMSMVIGGVTTSKQDITV